MAKRDHETLLVATHDALFGDKTAFGNFDRLRQATAAWKDAVDAAKAQRDIENAEKALTAERRRFWISAVPLLIGGITLLMQIQQYNENTRRSIEGAQDAEWRAVLETLKLQTPESQRQGLVLLTPFLRKDSRYLTSAREVAVYLLGASVEPYAFRVLFDRFNATTDWTNVQDVVRVAIQLGRMRTYIQDTLIRGEGASVGGQQRPSPQLALAAAERELGLVSRFLADYAKRERPDGFVWNFEDAVLSEADFTGVQLRAANLTNAVISKSSIRGALLCDIREPQFSGSKWDATAWWRAKGMEPELLHYLKREYAVRPDTVYFNDATAVGGYDAEVQRLEREASQVCVPQGKSN